MENDEKKEFEKYFFLFTDEEQQHVKDITLSELGYLSRNFENLVSSLPITSSCHQSNIIPKLAELITSFGLVKTFKEPEDRDYDSTDFPFEAKNAEECFGYLSLLLKYYDKIDTSSKRKFLVPVLLLCATHSSDYFWSSEKSVALSKDFLKNLLECSRHKTLNKLLCDDSFFPTIFKALLKRMRPNLMKYTWMKTPSSCYIFYWLLHHVKHPDLIHYLREVLPPSFMFSTHYSVPHQALGIKCFDHILGNVPPSCIKADGIEDVIFDVLKKFIYSKDAPVVEVLYPCLVKLPMMNLTKANHTEWFEFDTVLQQLLLNVDMESDPKLRCLFLSQLYIFVKVTPCFKHLKKSMDVLLQNFVANSVAEEECRVVSLKIIKELIRSCWPRMEHYCFDIMLGILKAIYDMEDPSYALEVTLSREVLAYCEECLWILKDACPETFKNLVEDYVKEDDSMPGSELLKKISEGT